MKVASLVVFSAVALWLAGTAGFATPQADHAAPDSLKPTPAALGGLIAPDRTAEAESLLKLYLGDWGESPGDRLPNQVLRRAGKGDAKAQFVVADCYKHGHGVKVDMTEAVRWMRKAAEQDFPIAQFELAYFYFNGRGVKTNVTEGVRWVRRAAELDHPSALSVLGVCYSTGTGVGKDNQEAARLWRKGAEQNSADAQFCLAVALWDGDGTARNEGEAIKWFRKAMEQKLNFEVSLTEKLLQLCGQVAGQGMPNAQFLLGRELTQGKLVKHDDVQAYKFLLLAARQGHKEAKKLLPKVATFLTKSDIAEATKMADEFKPEAWPP